MHWCIVLGCLFVLCALHGVAARSPCEGTLGRYAKVYLLMCVVTVAQAPTKRVPYIPLLTSFICSLFPFLSTRAVNMLTDAPYDPSTLKMHTCFLREDKPCVHRDEGLQQSEVKAWGFTDTLDLADYLANQSALPFTTSGKRCLI